MKITSLTLQAFRGFNKKEEFCLESADIIVLYGPNGHGKSSVYDAIEWVLTGGIHRFDEALPERRRTRFVRNLHADISDRSFVKLGIILSDERRFIIERECTATKSDRTDYGKYRLRIFDKNNELYKENEEAEDTLKRWLINEEWLPKISSTTTMLSLTHILSQEKIAGFLRGMQERERYDAMSIIFGTDHFDKYREGFRLVRNTLIAELEKFKVQIQERKSNRDNLQSEIKELESRIGDNEDTQFNNELENYFKVYPEARVYQNDLEKLIESTISNQQGIEMERKKLQNEYHLLNEVQEELPNLVYIREVQKNILHEQQQLQAFKKLYLSKLKIEQLLSATNEVNDDKLNIESLASKQEESNMQLDLFLKQRKILLLIIESINIQLATLSWKSGFEFLAEIKSKMAEEEYGKLEHAFKGMFEEYQFIVQNKSVEKKELIQLEALEESIEKIKNTHEMYSTFLTALNQYILIAAEDLNECPTCGTEGVKKVIF
ncbi:hypothetical protein IKS_03595 [Bacillus cereus VDM062]|nr:hypothetical protein IKS_03595 [Bacillus cereus VDM062]